MKKLIIFSAIISLLSVSCNTNDSAFDKSSGERIEQIWLDVDKILNEAPNGWSMEYFYDANVSYGGIQMFMRFDNGMVDVTSEVEEESDYYDTSTYSFAHDGGASINFDTYNDALHRFQAPSSSNTAGMGGDFEFIIINYSEDLITLRGKHNGVTYRMTPLREDKSWSDLMEDYLDAVSEMSKLKNYSLTVNGFEYETELDANFTHKNRRLLFTDPFGDGEVQAFPFVYTFTGLKFYEPVVLDGVEIREMEWTGKKFIDSESGAIIG